MAKYWLPSIELGGVVYKLTILPTTEFNEYSNYSNAIIGDEICTATVGVNNPQILETKVGSFNYDWTDLSRNSFTGNIEIIYNGVLIGGLHGGLYIDYSTHKGLAILVDDVTEEAWIIVTMLTRDGTPHIRGNFVKGNNAYLWAMGSLPILYNYKPVDYISSNGSTLKLSMIKEDFTNEGKIVEFENPEQIQRLTDGTNLRSLLISMTPGSTKILCYTDSDNYLELYKIGEFEDNVHMGSLRYYIDGVHRNELDVNQFEVSEDDDKRYYISFLVDEEKMVARQSIIKVYDDGHGSYNFLENVTDEYQSLMFEWLSTGYALSSSEDPQEMGGTSDTGGGNGSYNNIGDNIPLPAKPSISTVDANFVTVYNPTLSQIKSLAQYMWGDGFNLESFKKIFTDPMDCIIGLHLIPCEVPNSGVQNVKVGNLSSPVIMNLVSEQFVDVDCGSIKIEEYWGSYLDYSPYTKISIYLPYIGTQTLEVDDVMGRTVTIRYRIDIITGACTCFILVNNKVMYQYNGYCSANVPISSQDYRNTVSSIITMGTAVGTLAGTMAVGGAASVPMIGSNLSAFTSGVMNSKPTIAHGNNASGTGGFMSIQTPFITITRARQCLPKRQYTFTGYPSYITSQLASLKGYTQVEEIHLGSLSCTDAERSEIETLLKGGVII